MRHYGIDFRKDTVDRRHELLRDVRHKVRLHSRLDVASYGQHLMAVSYHYLHECAAQKRAPYHCHRIVWKLKFLVECQYDIDFSRFLIVELDFPYLPDLVSVDHHRRRQLEALHIVIGRHIEIRRLEKVDPLQVVDAEHQYQDCHYDRNSYGELL